MELESIIQEGVRNTLSFFAIFGKRLSKDELIQYFYIEKNEREKITFLKNKESEVRAILPEVMEKMDGIAIEDGKYILTKGIYEFSEESARELHAHLLQKCNTYIKMLSWIPYLQMVGIGNTLAFGSADRDSDIDLFIITAKDHVWFVRFLTGIFFHVLGVRRHGKKVSERFCLSFYADESVMDFRLIMLQPDDVYMRFWVATMKPFLGKKGYEAFVSANETMLKESFPFWKQEQETLYLTSDSSSQLKNLLEKFGNTALGRMLEHAIVKMQRKKMDILPVHLTEEASVVISDHMLKFHNKDRRKKYRDEWELMRKG